MFTVPASITAVSPGCGTPFGVQSLASRESPFPPNHVLVVAIAPDSPLKSMGENTPVRISSIKIQDAKSRRPDLWLVGNEVRRLVRRLPPKFPMEPIEAVQSDRAGKR